MSLVRAVATVGGLTLASRVLGFARDLLTAAFLGAGPVADAFVVALRLPNLFRSLFAEGAFSTAFVPLFAGAAATQGRDAARRFAEDALAVLLAALIAFTLAAELAMPWVIRIIAPGFAADAERFALAVDLTRITFPYLVLVSLVALYGGVLNALDRFAAQAAAPILLNLCLIAALLALSPMLPTPGHALAWGVAAAGFVQFAWVAAAAARAGLALALPRPRLTPMLRTLFRRMGPSVLGAGVTQINLLVATMLASLLPQGAIAHLYYADRLNQLPLGVVAIAVATVILPRLSRELRTADAATAIATQNRGLELAFLLTLPAAMGLALLAGPIVAVLFERGAFDPGDTAATAAALAAYAAGLPAFVVTRVAVTGFFAREDTRTPVWIALASFLANVGAILALMGPLGHVGIALATALAGWISAALMLGVQIRRGQFRADARLRRRLARLVVAVAAMAVVLLAAGHGLARVDLGGLLGPGLGRFAALVLLIAVGGIAFAAAATGLGAVRLGELRRLAARGRAGGAAEGPLDPGGGAGS